MRHSLVIGGAGFIGSHLTDSLLSDGHRVTVLDNLSSGDAANVPGHDDELFELLVGDVSSGLPRIGSVDEIYHLASLASPDDFSTRGLDIVEANVDGVRHVLDRAKRDDARVLFASTSEIYGDPEEHPQPETYTGNVDPTSVRAIYDESKRLSESIAHHYQRTRGVDTRVVRIFNTFGPRMPHDGRVMDTFIRQALRDEDLTVYGSGEQTRSFCYIHDLIPGIRQFMNLPEDALTYRTVNLGATHEVSINNLAALVQEVVQTSSSVVYQDARTDEPEQRKPDISRATSLLEWSPQTNLRKAIKKTADWYQTERPSARA